MSERQKKLVSELRQAILIAMRGGLSQGEAQIAIDTVAAELDQAGPYITAAVDHHKGSPT